MKTLKNISFILISMTFSSCYFLDNVIPEEYFAEEYIWVINRTEYNKSYSSLESAVCFLKDLGVTVYDAKEYSVANTWANKIVSSEDKVSYAAKINSDDINKLKNTNWDYWYNAK